MTEHHAPAVSDPFDGVEDTREDAYHDWDDYPTRRVPTRPSTPWHRSPAMLLMLIGLAAAILVIAAALLVTDRSSGEIPARPRLETRTSTAVAPTRASSTAPMTPTSSASPSPTPPEAVESGVEEIAPEPAAPAPSEVAPAASPSRSPQGPRINVTRTPMSFTPGRPG